MAEKAPEEVEYDGKGQLGQAIHDFKIAYAKGLTQEWPLYWKEFADQAFADLISLETKLSQMQIESTGKSLEDSEFDEVHSAMGFETFIKSHPRNFTSDEARYLHSWWREGAKFQQEKFIGIFKAKLIEMEERETHLESCVERLFNLTEKFPFHVNGLDTEAIEIYNSAEIRTKK
ncbi:MAG: hypothetical protein ACXVCY_04450 [Pseudobdellovibrionaceae bacterium]